MLDFLPWWPPISSKAVQYTRLHSWIDARNHQEQMTTHVSGAFPGFHLTGLEQEARSTNVQESPLTLAFRIDS